MRTANFEENGDVLERVDEFEYLDAVLNNGGGSKRAVMGGLKVLWRSFTERGSLLCGRILGFKQKGRLYKGCIRSVIGYWVEK